MCGDITNEISQDCHHLAAIGKVDTTDRAGQLQGTDGLFPDQILIKFMAGKRGYCFSMFFINIRIFVRTILALHE